jgi:squalene-hopene/tetraprenyl-beta-curcumene cyclase
MVQSSEARTQAVATCTAPWVQDRLRDAVRRSTQHLLSLQAPEGYWVGELQADTTLESDYIFYLHVIRKSEPHRIAKLANYIRRHQLPDGGWNIYVGGPSELNATIKAYLGLRLAGDSASAPHMTRARQRVHALGGLERSNSYVRFYLALSGAIGWEYVPAILPELMLLPRWFLINIYAMSSWTRAIVVPLMILYALKPRWPLPDGITVHELFCDASGRTPTFEQDPRPFTWRNFFLILERMLKIYDRLPWKPLRKRAARAATRWLLQHLEHSDGLGAIYPAMMNAVFALLALGYNPDDPLTKREIGQLARFEIEEDNTLRLQPCLSPVWDTAIVITSLREAGIASHHPDLVRAARWLLDCQVLAEGDWRTEGPSKGGGWAFEFRNDFFPDVDDTAFVLLALRQVTYPDSPRLQEAERRGLNWMMEMQNRDGGWGAFDHNNGSKLLTQIPFADHNAMIDPSTADLTARALECLGRYGWSASDPSVKRAIEFIKGDQTPEGAWYGRWGVNYIYGTSGVLRAMEALGLQNESYCQRAASWLRFTQNPDGGWGESCASYDDPSLKGKGESTPSQTAWGLIGLLATGDPTDSAVTRAVQYLVDQQQADGSWAEDAFTGTGFPRVFYLKYHLYANTFPLYALARYLHLLNGGNPLPATRPGPEESPGGNGNGHGNGNGNGNGGFA